MDSLLVVTATFFDAGEKFNGDSLDDVELLSFEAKDEEDYVEYGIREPESDGEGALGILRMAAPVLPDTVKKDFIAFEFTAIRLGAVDEHEGGVVGEIHDLGSDEVFFDFREEFSDYARDVRREENEARIAQIENKYGLFSDKTEKEEMLKKRLPVLSVRFMLAMDYSTSQDYWGEWDSEISIIGRITQQNLLKALRVSP